MSKIHVLLSLAATAASVQHKRSGDIIGAGGSVSPEYRPEESLQHTLISSLKSIRVASLENGEKYKESVGGNSAPDLAVSARKKVGVGELDLFSDSKVSSNHLGPSSVHPSSPSTENGDVAEAVKKIEMVDGHLILKREVYDSLEQSDNNALLDYHFIEPDTFFPKKTDSDVISHSFPADSNYCDPIITRSIYSKYDLNLDSRGFASSYAALVANKNFLSESRKEPDSDNPTINPKTYFEAHVSNDDISLHIDLNKKDMLTPLPQDKDEYALSADNKDIDISETVSKGERKVDSSQLYEGQSQNTVYNKSIITVLASEPQLQSTPVSGNPESKDSLISELSTSKSDETSYSSAKSIQQINSSFVNLDNTTLNDSQVSSEPSISGYVVPETSVSNSSVYTEVQFSEGKSSRTELSSGSQDTVVSIHNKEQSIDENSARSGSVFLGSSPSFTTSPLYVPHVKTFFQNPFTTFYSTSLDSTHSLREKLKISLGSDTSSNLAENQGFRIYGGSRFGGSESLPGYWSVYSRLSDSNDRRLPTGFLSSQLYPLDFGTPEVNSEQPHISTLGNRGFSLMKQRENFEHSWSDIPERDSLISTQSFGRTFVSVPDRYANLDSGEHRTSGIFSVQSAGLSVSDAQLGHKSYPHSSWTDFLHPSPRVGDYVEHSRTSNAREQEPHLMFTSDSDDDDDDTEEEYENDCEEC
ncbi:uncharacterized protein LOC134536041 isoform X1 [Bacillus rossius redtenbacheri]|uniref:uncharacterized protein LOC134536041 isoform X1 n=1 Tax=Bacillus rossius redtenbacheri TaxID=93214 RepID=UPI002FDE8236